MQIRYPSMLAIPLLSLGCSQFSSIPSCESDETRGLIEDIHWKNPGIPFIKSACVEISEYSDSFTILENAVTESECDRKRELIKKIISTEEKDARESYLLAQSESIPQRKDAFLHKYAAATKDYKEFKARLEKTVFVDDFKTTFVSYLVKSENVSQDNNSRTCRIRYELQTSSDELGNLKSINTYNLNLIIYKKDDNGNRAYEYDFE